MNKMMALIGAAVFLCTGCFLLGERPTQSRAIVLSFAAAERESKRSLSTNDAPVQEALRLVDAVLISDGYGPNTNRVGGNAPGFVISYAKYDTNGMSVACEPHGYLKDRRLGIAFAELGNRTGHFSPPTQKAFNSLRKELSNRFGARRVEVLKPPGG